jgi:inorganic pyrophosphatase
VVAHVARSRVAADDLDDVPDHMLREIEHFFDVFEELEERPVRSRAWIGRQEAEAFLERAIAAART